jgi:photoactive yellow protein
MSSTENDTQTASETTLQQLEEIDRMNERELDQLPFGAIRLDKDGKVLSYNRTEANLTGRDPQRVIGRNFFTQVAPCTNVQTFAGRFREGVAKREMHAIFPYRFDFEMAPRNVTVTLFYSRQTESAWVFVRESTEV